MLEAMNADESKMLRAIEIAQAGIAAGQTPFGAVIYRGETAIAATHNTVWQTIDPTAHAEVNAIRQASQVLRLIDLHGCVMYTTCEPCPMCLSAIHWSKIDRVIYGATIADAVAAGFAELCVGAEQMVAMGGSPLIVQRGPLQKACTDLFQQWKTAGLSRSY